MELRQITRNMLKECGACYSRKRIAELVPKGGVTLHQVLETDLIPEIDKVWVATRAEVLPEPIMAVWMGGIVERALWRSPDPDLRSLAVVTMLRRIAAGKIISPIDRERYLVNARKAVGVFPVDTISSFAAESAHVAAYGSFYPAACLACRAENVLWGTPYYDAPDSPESKQQVLDLLNLLNNMDGV